MKRAKPMAVKVGNITVKIYSRTRVVNGTVYPLHEVADYTTGRRRLRAFADKGEAQREAERIARALAAGETRVAQMKGPEASSYGRAVELLKPTGVPLEIAAGHFAEAFKLLGSDRIIEAAKFFLTHNPDKLTRRSVPEAVGELLAAKEKGASARYLQDLRARLNRFAQAFAVDISTVNTADIQRWLDGLKVSGQTTKNFRTVIGTLFNFAEARGYILKGQNPIEGTERTGGKNGAAVEIFTPAEIAKMLAAASREFLPCLALGAFAGLRSAEIERLDWSDVDLTAGHIVVAADKAKTASRRIVPIVPNLAQWLAPFAKAKGRVWEGLPDFGSARQEAAEAAGVQWKANALRHSFISYRLAEIQNAAQVALEAGNSPSVVFGHYREIVNAKAAKAWFSVFPTVEVANG